MYLSPEYNKYILYISHFDSERYKRSFYPNIIVEISMNSKYDYKNFKINRIYSKGL
jgi:hypothetical protein